MSTKTPLSVYLDPELMRALAFELVGDAPSREHLGTKWLHRCRYLSHVLFEPLGIFDANCNTEQGGHHESFQRVISRFN